MKRLVVLGAGEYGHLVKEMARDIYDEIVFLDDNSDKAVGKLKDVVNLKESYEDAFVAIGNAELRKKWMDVLEKSGFNVPTFISEKAYVSPSAVIEKGVVIEPMSVVHSFVKIAKGCIISAGAVINHNTVINEFCHIDCNAVVGAGVELEAKTNLDYGETVKRNTKIIPEIHK